MSSKKHYKKNIKLTTKIKSYKSFLNPFNHPATAFKVPVLKAVGGYRHCYLHEDWFLWLHFLKMGFQVANIDDFLVAFRVNQGTLNRRFGKDFRKYERNFFRAAIMGGLLNPVFAIFGLAVRQIAKLFGKSIFQFLYRRSHFLSKPKKG